MEARRGRPPVRCSEKTPCTRVDSPAKPKGGTMTRTTSNAPEVIHDPTKPINPSLLLAKAAKERLVALGWTVEGKAGLGEHYWAEISASRGEETLLMRWIDQELTAQEYSLFSEKPSDNGIPSSALGFDPNEITDLELLERIRGMKVTWWNTLAGASQNAVIGGKVSIEHIHDQGEHYDASKRIVKFIDRNAGGFRAFHVGALVKVG